MKFPIIVLKNNDSNIYVFKTLKSLRSASEDALEKQIWKDCKVFDSDGNKYDIIEVKKNSYKGLFGWNPLVKGREIYLDFKFSEPEDISTSDVKDEIIKVLKVHKKFYHSVEVNVLVEMIKNSMSIESIAEIMK